jgi:hypothetical protein
VPPSGGATADLYCLVLVTFRCSSSSGDVSLPAIGRSVSMHAFRQARLGGRSSPKGRGLLRVSSGASATCVRVQLWTPDAEACPTRRSLVWRLGDSRLHRAAGF